MKLNLLPDAIYRVPRFSYIEPLESNWNSLKEIIGGSSPDFYNVIKDLDFEGLQVAPERIRMTVHKYYNRARFRATPYGAFAAVGMCQLGSDKSAALQLSDEQTEHTFPDWSHTLGVDASLADVYNSRLLLFANTSYYRVGDELRFLQESEKTFSLAAIGYDQVAEQILMSCHQPTDFHTLAALMEGVIPPGSLAEYVSDLISCQLLIPSSYHNIIGQQYFTRINKVIPPTGRSYIITERRIKEGAMDATVFRHLEQAASLLQSVTEPIGLADLEQFKARFLHKFEQNEVPLMVALDPEVGIGYGDREQTPVATGLSLFQQDSEEHAPSFSGSTLAAQLIKQLLKKKNNPHAIIQLDDLVTTQAPEQLVPNTITAICTVVDELVFLDYLGGVTANGVAGRFALALKDIERYCHKIAAMECEANPGVCFFDIGYTREHDVDNINRRPALYDYQLNILNYDTSSDPLCINDIWVCIQGDEVVLLSKKLKKRVVPRVASAYNYTRSDLSLFRFLIDIQRQGLKANLLFRSEILIPGLDHYPRIQYRNIVISPACWRLSGDLFAKAGWQGAKVAALRDHLRLALNLRHVRIGSGDETLLLDSHNSMDMQLLVSIIEKNKNILVEEASLPISPRVHDKGGRPYLLQSVVTLFHKREIIKPYQSIALSASAELGEQWVLPGGSWLYFEIFCSPVNAEQILIKRIKPYIRQFDGLITKWFFIRYNDTGHHIRLRLKIKEEKLSYHLIRSLSDMLERELRSGIISDVRLCTYKPEVQRYGKVHITDVERHFCSDSNYAMHMLSVMLPDLAKYRLCIDILFSVQQSGIIAPESFIELINKIVGSFNAEHNMQIGKFKELNKLYKEYLATPFPSLTKKAGIMHQRLKAHLLATLEKYNPKQRRKIMADLLHMHSNRLFSESQRTHEMVFYNFFLMEMKRLQFTSDSELNFFESGK